MNGVDQTNIMLIVLGQCTGELTSERGNKVCLQLKIGMIMG